MRTHAGWTAIQQTAALAMLSVSTAWLVTVPAVPTPINFVTVAGLLIAFGWVAKTISQSGESANSVGQLLYATENADSFGQWRNKE